MFKDILVPKRIFNLDVIKPKMKAVYSVRDGYWCPITEEWLDYKSYEGIIDCVYEDGLKFISNDTRINYISDKEYPVIEKWLEVKHIDGYYIKLELKTE